MMEFNSFAKILIILGAIMLSLGIFLLLVGKLPFLGKLPGDIYIRRGNFTFYFPIITSLLLSIIITLIVNLLMRGLK